MGTFTLQSSVLLILLAVGLLLNHSAEAQSFDPSLTFANFTTTSGSVTTASVFLVTPISTNGSIYSGNVAFTATLQTTSNAPIYNQFNLTQPTYSASTSTYSFSFSTQIAGTYNVYVYGNGVEIAGCPLTYVIQPGQASKTTSVFSGSFVGSGSGNAPISANVGTNGILTIAFYDQYSNPIAPPLVYLDFSTTEYQQTNVFYNFSMVGSQSSTFNIYNWNFFFTKIGVFQINIRYNPPNQSPIAFFSSPLITLLPSTLSIPSSTVTLRELAPGNAPQVSVTGSTIWINAMDSYGNPITPQQVNTQVYSQFECVFSLVGTTRSGVSNITYSFYSSLPASISSSKYYICQYTNLTVAGQYILSVFGSDGVTLVGGKNYTVNFAPSLTDLSAANSFLTGLNAAVNKEVGFEYGFQIVLVDTYGNYEISGTTFLPDFTAQLSLTTDSTDVAIVDLADNGDGSYSATYTLHRSGSWILDVFYYLDSVTGSAVTISSFTITSPAECVATGDGLHSCQSGSTCRFIVQTRDQFSNNQTTSGDNITMTLNGSPSGDVTDYDNGFYGVSYIGPPSGAGKATLAVFVNGGEISGSPFTISVSPSDAVVGVIIAVVILAVLFGLIIGYIIYKRQQIKRLRREWAMKKAAAYKEYQMGATGTPQPLSAMMKTDEPEWEDEEDWKNPPEDYDPEIDGEWSEMQKWMGGPRKMQDSVSNAELEEAWSGEEMDALQKALRRQSQMPGQMPGSRPISQVGPSFVAGKK